MQDWIHMRLMGNIILTKPISFTRRSYVWIDGSSGPFSITGSTEFDGITVSSSTVEFSGLTFQNSQTVHVLDSCYLQRALSLSRCGVFFFTFASSSFYSPPNFLFPPSQAISISESSVSILDCTFTSNEAVSKRCFSISPACTL